MDETCAVVEVDRLTKRFGTVTAVDEVSFSVAEGEVFGFLRPDGGTARIGGHDCWHDHGRAARLFGATVEQPGLYGYLSGRDNLRQFARMLGAVDDRRITDLLAMVGMT